MKKELDKKWYVYILKCSDNTLYTGITTDVTRRLKEHNNGRGAKYTRNRRPIELMTVFEVNNRSEASKEEYRIKQLKREEKFKLININNEK